MKINLSNLSYLTAVFVALTFNLRAQLPVELKKYFGGSIQDKLTLDSMVYISDCDQFYDFFNERLREAIKFDDHMKYQYLTELHIDKIKHSGYLVIYEYYIGSSAKPRVVLTRSRVINGKLNGITNVFKGGSLTAKLNYKNGLKDGMQYFIMSNQNQLEYVYDNYKKGLLHGQSVRTTSNNDTIYYRIYKEGNYKYSFVEKLPITYTPKVRIKYKKYLH